MNLNNILKIKKILKKLEKYSSFEVFIKNFNHETKTL